MFYCPLTVNKIEEKAKMPITLRNTIQKGLIGNEWGAPTIYWDPKTGEMVKSDEITAIGVTNPDYKTSLPEYTTVIQVGTNVKEVHFINVIGNIIPENIFKDAGNVTDFRNVFRYTDIEEIPDGLFNRCTKVTNFAAAFEDCQQLKAIPAGLFDKNTLATNFDDTFFGCINIETVPEGLFDNCSNATSFNGTFYKCLGLKSIPKGLFDNCVNAESFNTTFSHCDSLSSIPAGLFGQCSNATDFNNAFLNCKQLSEIPADLFEHCTKATEFYSTFGECKQITSIPKGLFDGCINADSFFNTFYNCESLRSIPEDLFQNNTKVTDFRRTFSSCSRLEGEMPMVTAPDGKKYMLWELTKIPGYPDHISGNGCFYNCENLHYYAYAPENWRNI